MDKFSGFSRELAYARCRLSQAIGVLSGSALAVGLPAAINAYTLQPAILTVSSIGLAVRLSLRSRLTLIRLALIRKPWSFGGRVSRPPYRYSYLHLLFHALQQGSSLIFDAAWNAPLPSFSDPRLRHGIYARLLSTPDRSTSELLRTL